MKRLISPPYLYPSLWAFILLRGAAEKVIEAALDCGVSKILFDTAKKEQLMAVCTHISK